MPLQTIDNDRLYRKIARQLSELIASGEFTPGQRLPAERELALQFGVSRPSVREALIALEIEGKVEVRVGAGIFVATPSFPAVGSVVDVGEGTFELLRARYVVEGEIAAVAAQCLQPADVAQMTAAVKDMQRLQKNNEDTDAADRAFHLAVAGATHNSVMVALIRALWDNGRGAMWRQMEKHFQTASLRAATLRDHKAILKAVAEGDGRAARAAMKCHLERVDREFTRGWEQLKGKKKVHAGK